MSNGVDRIRVTFQCWGCGVEGHVTHRLPPEVMNAHGIHIGFEHIPNGWVRISIADRDTEADGIYHDRDCAAAALHFDTVREQVQRETQ